MKHKRPFCCRWLKREVQCYWGETSCKSLIRLEKYFTLHTLPILREVLDNHKQVFSDELGTLKDHRVKGRTSQASVL